MPIAHERVIITGPEDQLISLKRRLEHHPDYHLITVLRDTPNLFEYAQASLNLNGSLSDLATKRSPWTYGLSARKLLRWERVEGEPWKDADGLLLETHMKGETPHFIATWWLPDLPDAAADCRKQASLDFALEQALAFADSPDAEAETAISLNPPKKVKPDYLRNPPKPKVDWPLHLAEQTMAHGTPLFNRPLNKLSK